MRLLVCGGRHYDDADAVRGELDGAHGTGPLTVLIHGGLAGIGTAAEAWAREHNVHVVRYPPNWTLLGNKAEAHRNAFMLADSRPDMVLAFPGGRDTAELVRTARAAGLPVLCVRIHTIMTGAGNDACEGLGGDQPEGRSRGALPPQARRGHAALTATLQ